MTYKKSILLFLVFFLGFSLLLKHGIDSSHQTHHFSLATDVFDTLTDSDEVTGDICVELLFESNDDLILPSSAILSASAFFPLISFVLIDYLTPYRSKLLRPPSII
jgi:hypothetical protein